MLRRFGLALLWLAAGCMNDYDRFSVSGSGGSAGQTGGSAGQGGSAQGGASGKSGSGGSSEGGTSGSAGDGNVGGSAGAGGGPCDLMCSGECATAGDTNCGACGNDCTVQGHAGGFRCSSGLCGCVESNHCREASGGTVLCLVVDGAGLCVCGTTPCMPGEACRRVDGAQRCGCNSGDACAAGQTCCQTPAGCKDLLSDDENCGACGRACTDGTSCSNGSCE